MHVPWYRILRGESKKWCRILRGESKKQHDVYMPLRLVPSNKSMEKKKKKKKSMEEITVFNNCYGKYYNFFFLRNKYYK